ncbi:threonine/serine exporter family protein [Actinophytocola sp. KF-1]
MNGRADGELYAFVLEAGRALSLAGAAVGETQERMTRIAVAAGAAGVRVIVLPTALVIALDAAGPATIESVPQLTGALRLDQISVVYEVVGQAERGAVAPADGLRRLHEMRTLPPRRGRVAVVAGHAVMTVGLCLLLRPSLRDVVLAAGLGALVGGLRLAVPGHRTVSVLIPVVAAAVAGFVAFAAVRHGFADPGLRPLVAALVAFLPGGVLVTGTMELASGEMVAGAGRLVYGAFQLLLLTAGIVAGAALAGLPGDAVPRDEPGDVLGWWAPTLGVVLFGVAVSVYFSAPRGALPWLMAVLCTAWLGQLAGEWLLGPNGSGFVGALAMTPVALAVSRLPAGPPAQVTFLPAFWLLAPGAVGLIGVTEAVTDPAASAVAQLVPPLAAILAIALGVLCGTAVHSGLAGARRGS